jgi:hypothetical protein
MGLTWRFYLKVASLNKGRELIFWALNESCKSKLKSSSKRVGYRVEREIRHEAYLTFSGDSRQFDSGEFYGLLSHEIARPSDLYSPLQGSKGVTRSWEGAFRFAGIFLQGRCYALADGKKRGGESKRVTRPCLIHSTT